MLTNELSETLALDGFWDFRLGEGAPWGEIQVPGCWEAQGYSKSLDGPAFYRRQVIIPESWRGQRIQAEFGAASYAASLSLNGQPVGEHRGLWTPFAVDLTAVARPGEVNLLEVQLYKPGDPGGCYPMRSCLAGFLPDVATAFGGLWQPVLLRALPVGLEGLQLDPLCEPGSLRLRSRAWAWGPLERPEWLVEVFLGEQMVAGRRLACPASGELDLHLELPQRRLWSPVEPALYRARVTLLAGSEPVARANQRTGFRRLGARGSQLLLNGEPFMARGILSWGWEPERIAPYYSRQQARAELRRARELGFNLVKLCLFVPNQAYFDLADEEGLLLWQELPLWLPRVTAELRRQAPLEYAELARLTRHHPSVALYSLGCELSQEVDGELLGQLERAVRSQVTGALLCDNSGSGESYGGLDYDLADFSDYHPYFDLHYFEPLLDNWRRDWQPPRPWIFGEFCDSDTFRDQEQLMQANGGQRPWWLTPDNPVTAWRSEAQAALQAGARLARAALPFSPQQITRISYAQSLVIRKYTLEALRRRAGMGGYVVTGLRDTPISTSGIWDDRLQPKWSPAEFGPLNGAAVLCLEVDRRRQWRHGGDRPERLDAHNFWSGSPARWHLILHACGPEFPPGSRLSWQLSDRQGNELAGGQAVTTAVIRPGQPGEVGVFACHLPEVRRGVELELQVSLAGPAGQLIANHWPVWVYPPLASPDPGLRLLDPDHSLDDCGDWLARVPRLDGQADFSGCQLLLTTAWSAEVAVYLRQGGRALLLQRGAGPLPACRLPFWREAIQLFYNHPLWQRFPQRGHADLQFFGLASDVAFDSPRWPQALPDLAEVRPLLRRLDARQFLVSDYLLEARLGAGRLLACSLRLPGGAGAQPYGWQRNVAGAALLQAMLGYLADPGEEASGD